MILYFTVFTFDFPECRGHTELDTSQLLVLECMSIYEIDSRMSRNYNEVSEEKSKEERGRYLILHDCGNLSSTLVDVQIRVAAYLSGRDHRSQRTLFCASAKHCVRQPIFRTPPASRPLDTNSLRRICLADSEEKV